MKKKIVMKVAMPCEKCRVKAMEVAAVANGVTSVALGGAENDELVVIGEEVDSVCLAKELRKKVGHTTFVSVGVVEA